MMEYSTVALPAYHAGADNTGAAGSLVRSPQTPKNEFCRWSREIEGYSINRCKAWERQLSRQFTKDDLIQEAYIVYLKAVADYGSIVKSEKHFMGIFKKCLYFRFWRFERDSKSAARRGCGGFWLGEHDKEIADQHHDSTCLDETPAVIQRMLARMGIGGPWYRGRRFIRVRKKRNESKFEFIRRLVGGNDNDLATALNHLNIEDPNQCTL